MTDPQALSILTKRQLLASLDEVNELLKTVRGTDAAKLKEKRDEINRLLDKKKRPSL